jgi:hypothetical protein
MSEHNEIEDTEAGLEPQRLDFDPKEIERQLLEEANNRAQDPSEMAATMYSMYVPHYKRVVPKLSTRSLRRILNYLVLYPFEQDSVKPTSELEKEVMQLTSSLIEAKIIMIMDTYRQNAEQLYEAANAPLTAEQEAEIREQINNEEK